jgi:hypothetical protein
MKPKTAFGRVKHGTRPVILSHGFAARMSRKKMALKNAPYQAQIIGRG